MAVKKGYSKNGIFRFRFYVKNRWYGINIDDRLPSRSWGSSFIPWATQPSKNGAWWMPLLEKAYAKLNQNYERLTGGNGHEAFRTLTGMPTAYFTHRLGKTKMMKLHKYGASRNMPMTTACCSGGSKFGLVTGHAYSLLDVQQVGKILMAKVRNPWNKEKYTGPYRDSDPAWTDAMKKQVGLVKSDDGIFWMPYDNYITTFYDTKIVIFDKFKTTKLNIVQKESAAFYKFTNPADQEVFFSLDYNSPRNYPRNAKCSPAQKVAYIVMNQKTRYRFDVPVSTAWANNNGWGSVGSFDGTKLPAGSYIIYIWNMDSRTKAADFTVHVYSTKGISKPVKGSGCPYS